MRVGDTIEHLSHIPDGVDAMPVRNLGNLGRLDAKQRTELAELLAEVQRRAGMRQLATMFPGLRPAGATKYPKQLEFFRAGRKFFQRVFMAANRVGKDHGRRYRWSYHLTGEYPHWWKAHASTSPCGCW